MHSDAFKILEKYGVEKTVMKGLYKYSSSCQKFRVTPQIPEKAYCFDSNQNVLACDNKENEHSYIIWYNLKSEQLATWSKGKIGEITEKNGRKSVIDTYYSSTR